ncbi:MAG: flagellar filament capping protein FliD [Candidatus Schekmanbacteria bacterium]|nr:flagellar filament capping protein FliD [Candidatus Schekmanbacteria bacterium]
MGISVGGLASGINFNDIISQLQQYEQKPITILNERKQGYQTKIDALNTLNTNLASLLSEGQSLNNISQFNIKSVSVSDADLLTASASSTAQTGNYAVEIMQTATSNKIACQGWEDINVTPVSAISGNFSFKVGSGSVTTISINDTTTLQQLKDSINNSNAGVSASIINDGSPSKPYRLVLSTSSTGADNNISITANDTNLDFSNKTIGSAYSNPSNSFNGTITSSGTYTGSESKPYLIEMTTLGGIGTAKFKVSTDGGLTWTADDAFTTSASATSIYDASDEGVDISFAAGSSDFSVGDRFEIDTYDPTLQEAADAIIKVNNINFRKSSNIIDDIIPGVTINLKSAQQNTSVNLAVSQDNDTVKKNINDFISAYNKVVTLIKDQTAYDPSNGVKGPLLGNSSVNNAQTMLKRIISNIVPGITDTYTTLSQIGISTGQDGTLSINDSKLTDALNDHYDNVARLFVKYGSTTNSEIAYSISSDKTDGGTYDVNITQAPLQAIVIGSQTIQSEGLASDETLTFVYSGNSYDVNLSAGDKIDQVVSKINSQLSNQSVLISAVNNNGALKLFSQDYGTGISFSVNSDQADSAESTGIGITGKSGTGQDVAGTINGHSATAIGNSLTGADDYEEEGLQILIYSSSTGAKGSVTLSIGVAEQMVNQLDFMTDSTDGTLQTGINGLEDSIKKIDESITRQTNSINKYVERLQAQFASMETLISSLNAQDAALSSLISSF